MRGRSRSIVILLRLISVRISTGSLRSVRAHSKSLVCPPWCYRIRWRPSVGMRSRATEHWRLFTSGQPLFLLSVLPLSGIRSLLRLLSAQVAPTTSSMVAAFTKRERLDNRWSSCPQRVLRQSLWFLQGPMRSVHKHSKMLRR